MSPEIIIRSVMFDPASCPAFPAVPVKDFCLYDLPAGETACCPVPVKKSVTAVREKLQPVLPGDRAAQTGKFFMEQFQGFQQVFRKLPQEYVLCRVPQRADCLPGPSSEWNPAASRRETASLSMASSRPNTSLNVIMVTSFHWHGTVSPCHGPIIRESPGEVRSGCVGAGTELIPGPVNLHELPGINGQAGLRQVVHDGKRRRQEPLLPVPFELADDIFHVIFIN